MASAKETYDKTIGIINSIMTILNKFPKDVKGDSLSLNLSLNPFNLLLEVLKSTEGYNNIIKMISRYLTYALPSVEIAVKTFLSVNMKNLLNCSLNPFITKELLKYGVTFDLNEIDLFNNLAFPPNTSDASHIFSYESIKKGKFLYFGCDELKFNNLNVAEDFNAFLYFIASNKNNRYVWTKPKDLITITDDNKNSYNYRDKSKAIITLEYNNYFEDVTNAVGGAMEGQKLPDRNCLQVFIGDATDMDDTKILKEIARIENELSGFRANLEKLKTKLNDYNKKLNEYTTSKNIIQSVSNTIKSEQYQKKIDKTNKDISECENKIKEKTNHIEILNNALLNHTKSYPEIEKNRYYKKTLIEFNIDYIWSLKLFDSKVITAKLLDALFNSLTIDLGMSYEHLMLVNETRKIVQSIIETDDAEVNDCFFSFDNSTYNSLMELSENQYRGLQTYSDNSASNMVLSPEDILNSLNNMSDSSTKEELSSIIEGTLRDISGEIINKTYDDQNNFSFSFQFNIIENLLNNLALALTEIVLSPKVYLLLAINMKIMGQETNLTLAEIIANYKNLLVGLIRMLRDNLLTYLHNEIMKIIGDLIKEISLKLSTEQLTYYYNILKRCIDCFRMKRQLVGFTLEQVDYADIYPQQQSTPTSQC